MSSIPFVSRPFLPHPPVVCICGPKKSGKTLLTERLVRCLTGRGLAVGTLKHDGHDFTLDPLDREGTDSWRHRAAGAGASAVFSAHRWALFRDGEPDLTTLLGLMADMDLVLAEGLKGSAWPKILVLGPEPVPVAPPVWALVGEGAVPEGPSLVACPRFRPDAADAVAALILSRVARS